MKKGIFKNIGPLTCRGDIEMHHHITAKKKAHLPDSHSGPQGTSLLLTRAAAATTGMPILLLVLFFFTANGEMACPTDVHLGGEALDYGHETRKRSALLINKGFAADLQGRHFI